jgi:hypothetical protein
VGPSHLAELEVHFKPRYQSDAGAVAWLVGVAAQTKLRSSYGKRPELYTLQTQVILGIIEANLLYNSVAVVAVGVFVLVLRGEGS